MDNADTAFLNREITVVPHRTLFTSTHPRHLSTGFGYKNGYKNALLGFRFHCPGKFASINRNRYFPFTIIVGEIIGKGDMALLSCT